MRLWRAGAVVGVAMFLACSAQDHPKYLTDGAPDGGTADAGADGDDGGTSLHFDASMPTPDGACGYTSVNISVDPAHLYFVIDRSGSMGESVGGKEKFTAVRNAALNLAAQVGFRAQIGGAVFPHPGSADGCTAGGEVFPLRIGDPFSYWMNDKSYGPVTLALGKAINVAPGGGTPTAPTLDGLRPMLSAVGKNTFVILATDGGPNCDFDISCEADQCTPNLDGDQGCTPKLNCCDPTISPNFSGGSCLDANATLSAVSSLASAGVQTVVVGIPGSEAYADLLDSLAVAGGAPRATEPRYYRVDDLDSLDSVLTTIGQDVVVSCDLTLSAAPMNQDLVNVWFDDTEVTRDPVNGWTWTGDSTIEVHGDACGSLESGSVQVVQIFEGCPTVYPSMK